MFQSLRKLVQPTVVRVKGKSVYPFGAGEKEKSRRRRQIAEGKIKGDKE